MSEVLINREGKTHAYKYFHYESLRKSFMKCLLDLLYNEIKIPEFYKLKSLLYKKKGKDFMYMLLKSNLTLLNIITSKLLLNMSQDTLIIHR